MQPGKQKCDIVQESFIHLFTDKAPINTGMILVLEL